MNAPSRSTPSRISVAIGIALALGACASTGGSTGAAAPARGAVAVDSAYVAAVERIALRRGIDVQWVNKPTRRVRQD